jgi:hypothetical protein
MTAAWRSIRTFRPTAHRRRRRLLATSGPLRFRPSFDLVEDRTLLSTFMVTSTADSGPGSLRQAILDSNAATAQANTIDFAIPGSGVQTLAPASPLPPITRAVLVDGESQPGYAGTPLVQIDGSQAGGGDGLTITGSNVTVRGLDISNFSQGAGIHITGTGATGNWLYGNFLGTDPTGTQALGSNVGVEIDAGATKNLVGTNGDGVNDTAERNIISGNLFAGVWITGQGTSNNAVAGNFIGTDISGSVALNNGTQAVSDPSGAVFGGGVAISAGASANRIGTDGKGIDDVAQRNVIGGSGEDGVDIYGTGTDGNVVAGNYIGSDLTGTASLGIYNDGVLLAEGASSNWIGVNPLGGTATGDEGNVIPGNDIDGIQLVSGADGNTIAGNKVGTDASGTVVLPDPIYYKFNYGVEVDAPCVGNTIGGTASGAGNLVSGNWAGIAMSGSANLIEANKIGTDITGTVALGNVYSGIQIDGGASSNTIGGPAAGAGNVISANGQTAVNRQYGVYITGAGTSGNLLQGNKIGTDITGTVALGNANSGIQIDGGASDNTIGGSTASEGNLITYNGGSGVEVIGASSLGDQITANRIFGNTGEAIDLGNPGVTYNSPSPRQGPNNLQNFPVVYATTDGQLQGGLWGSLPDTPFRIDVFASAAYRSDGSGEAQDYLGSLEVTTDPRGQVVFTVPFGAPAGLPIITATATDPQGNTSEVSALRRATLKLPPPSIRVVRDQALSFSTASGDGVAIKDPDAGPLNPGWNLTLSVAAGTLTLASTAGLTGSGNGTGSLSYSGSLAALDAALQGLSYSPPVAGHVLTILTMNAQSDGAAPLESQLQLTDGVFVVNTTAESGAGSLRQAILDANSVTAGTATIDFAIPGAGVQTIEPLTPLPPITAPTLIDGTTQPGFAGTPLIALSGPSPRNSGTLAISGGDITIRGLALDGVAIDPTMDENLIAVVATRAHMTQLSLLDAQSNVLIQSSGPSTGDPDPVIDEHLAAGHYSLRMDDTSGPGGYTWTVMLMPAAAPFQPIPAGSGADNFLGGDAMVAGDFNGDGHLDLAVANQASNYISVLLGNGDGTFQPQVTYAVGTEPDALVAGDFNGDGRLDLAVANQSLGQPGTVSVLLGNGDGTFQSQVIYAVGSRPIDLVAGDFNGDGRLDLAVANYVQPGTVSMLVGNGDGTFQPPVAYPVGSYPHALVAGYFTGSGHLDLAVANSGDNTVSVLLGNGDGTFQAQVAYAVGSAAQCITARDFAGNGRLDLAVGDADGVQILEGNGDGSFQAPVAYSAGVVDPYAIVCGDFNGDGHLDIAALSIGDLVLLLGNGDGTFQQARHPGILADGGLVAGDFNGDGRLDLAATINGPGQADGASVFLGNGDGTFQSPGQGDAGTPNPGSIVAGDFNGDGHLDMAVANEFSNDISVFLGNGDGTFQTQVTYAVGSGPQAIAAGDFNGDGRLDLAVANSFDNTVSVLLGNGDGTFQPAVEYAVGGFPISLVAGDFNGDGRLDMAVANTAGTVSVLLGNGNGTFQPQANYPAGNFPYSIAAGDFTGDGRLDLAVADQLGNTVSVLLGNGDGTFQPAVQYPVGGLPDDIISGDFNGDRRTDLAVADLGNGTAASTVSVLLGSGNGTFQPAVQYSGGTEPGFIAAGDFTGDGHTDLAVAGGYPSNYISVLLGNGDGTFQPPVTNTVGLKPFGLLAADFNGDGRTDLAVAGSVILGNGDGTFSDSSQLVTAPHATPLVDDVNSDGINDTLVIDGHGNILYRQSIPGQPGSFEPPVTVNPGSPSRDIAWVPNTAQGPVLASVDAHDDAISFYAFRNGGFVQIGSLATGRLPAQIIAADLNGDGLTDLVVRNAGDGTLSVYLGSPFLRSSFIGPLNPQLVPPGFLPPVTLPVGIGASDVQAVDTTRSGMLDLVVTNKPTGQVSILRNLGKGTFAPPEPYRAGNGLSAIDTTGTPEVTSLAATAGVAAGPLKPGGPTNLVTANPGSNTMDVLAGLGQGRFANPVTIDTPGPALAVRIGDFTGNGVNDLALLSANALRVYIGDGKGGFLPPTTYAVPSEANGLTIADLLGNGKLDLLVGDAYGDVLVLLGNGDGSFRPYHEADQAVTLAEADLTGNGSRDVIYADQGLNRVVVDYGAGGTTVLGDQATGLLSPGAVKLADLNGDGIPDLIVANSGSNNVLIYPGVGNGQFGPSVNGGHGYFVGTNPVGITVANLTGNLPDLVVADKGSNQVSILLNTSQRGGTISFNAGPRLNSGGIGPVSTVVGNFTPGSANQDILVTNSGSNNVALLPGVGGGFFNDTNPQTFAVGTNPGPLFVGNFDGKPDLVTVNAGSNDLTLISDFMAPDAVTETISSGGADPVTAFSFSSGSGFDDLVVGNGGDGVLALFEGSDQGLSLSSTETNPDLPSPSALVYAGLTGGQVQFYGANDGREAAVLVALSLGGEIAPLAAAAAPATPVVAQVVPLQESSLALVGTFLITTLPSPTTEVNLESAESQVATTVSLATATSASFGQSVPVQPRADDGGGGSGEESPVPTQEAKAAAEAPGAPSWQSHVLGTDEAIERFDREHPDLSQPSRHEPPQPEKPQERGHSTGYEARERNAVAVVAVGCVKRSADAPSVCLGTRGGSVLRLTHPTKDRTRCDFAAALALAATVAGEFYFRSTHDTSRVRSRFSAPQGRWSMRGKTENPARVPTPAGGLRSFC